MKEEIVKEYYENGELKSEGILVHLMDCTSIGGPLDCHGEGCVECIGMTTRKVGVWKYYHNNGNIKMEGKYQVLRFMGLPIVKTGIWKYYYNNGNIKMEGEYNGYIYKPYEHWGIRCGVWKLHDKIGQLMDEVTYKNGEVI
jgi:antitoxin component YwqK of YwqJK toxin-antitoxin module